jgi:hypothetical protein
LTDEYVKYLIQESPHTAGAKEILDRIERRQLYKVGTCGTATKHLGNVIWLDILLQIS